MINFVRAFLAIQDYAAGNGLSANETVLLLGLFRALNDRRFPAGMVGLSNNQLLVHTTFNGSHRDETLREARRRLEQRGVIRFAPPRERGGMPMYAILWDALGVETSSVALTGDTFPASAGKALETDGEGRETDDPEDGPQDGPQDGPESGPKNRPRLIYNNIPTVRTMGKGNREDEEPDSVYTAHARAALLRAYPGTAPPGHWPGQLAQAAHEYCLPADMMCEAIRQAAKRGAASPVAYAVQVMRDMYENGDRNRGLYLCRLMREGYY